MNVPPMLTDAFKNIFLSQQNRPTKMAYFDNMVSNIFTGRIQELIVAKTQGRPVIGTFCVYVPEEIIQAVNVPEQPEIVGAIGAALHQEKSSV